VPKEKGLADYAVEYAIRRPAHRPQVRDVAHPKSQQEHRRLQKQRMPRQKTAAFYISRKTVPAQNKAKQISRSIEQACGNLGSDPIEDERACASSVQVADENAI
jgi:hypothetical protein